MATFHVTNQILLRSLLALLLLLAFAWGALAFWFQLPSPVAVIGIAIWCLLGIASIVALVRAPRKRVAPVIAAAAAVTAGVMLVWWQSIKSSHERRWADDVARMLESDVSGNRITLRNVRSFDWRSETQYTQRWETQNYDLSQLTSADLILSYWMGPQIAHTLVSFGFKDGRKLVFSLEIRKERHESFSAIGGFFRRFEQVIIAANESDIVKTRSNARGEQVYIYRLRASPDRLRTVFLDYLERAEKLRRKPEFYNTLTSNCTTILFELGRQITPKLPLDYRLILSGYFAEYAFDQRALTPGFPYRVLQQRGHINMRARHADVSDANFSRMIRVGVPGVPAWETQ
jgi:hypothetical protein